MLVVAGEVVAPDPDITFWRACTAELVKSRATRQARVAKVRFQMRTSLVLVDLFTTSSDAAEFLDIVIEK